jgi:hypothetical protein
MTIIDASDAFNLGKSLLDAHDDIHNYYMSNWETLLQPDRDRLQSLAITLYQNASDVITHGVGVVLDDLSVSVNGLISVTNKVEKAVQGINDVKKIIDIATALIGFAAAIPTGELSTIVSSGKNLITVAGITGNLTQG